jgi:hypothetical protein
MMASELLGLYLVSAKGERTAICDVHSFGAALDANWHEYWYTGPDKKSTTAARHHRSKGEIAAYENHHEVALENDIAVGGRAALLHSHKRKSSDIWLFGPLSLLERPYGSLIIELSNYAPRKILGKTDKNSHIKWWAEFPKSPAGFNPCKILQTGFHLPVGPTSVPDIDVLRDVRAGAHHQAILKPFVRAEWSVKSRIAAQTDCALYEQEGL